MFKLIPRPRKDKGGWKKTLDVQDSPWTPTGITTDGSWILLVSLEYGTALLVQEANSLQQELRLKSMLSSSII